MGAVAKRPGACPMDVPVTARIAGRLWRTSLDFNEAPVLMRHLATAAFIVCAYLTGMRTQEKRAKLHLMQHSAGPDNLRFRSSVAHFRNGFLIV